MSSSLCFFFVTLNSKASPSPKELLQAKGYEGYKRGEPSNVLRLSNLPRKNRVERIELLKIFGHFVAPGQSPECVFLTQLQFTLCLVCSLNLTCDTVPSDIEIRVMEGRMSGQAFVTLANQELAAEALEAVHGYVFNGKPLFVVRSSFSNILASIC